MISVTFGMAVGTAMSTASVLLLDDFDDHMRARGMDPAVAEGLSDQRIYVRDEGKSHFAYDILRLDNPFAKGAEWPHMEMSRTDSLIGQCRVNVHEIDVRAMAAKMMDATTDSIRPISPDINKLFNDYVLLHEARHCHSDTRDMQKNTGEADADHHALLALAGQEGGDELAATVRHMRALSLMRTRTHDTILILDAYRHGIMPPFEEQIDAITRKISKNIASKAFEACTTKGIVSGPSINQTLNRAYNDSMKQPEFLPLLMQRIYDEEGLEPLVKRRIGLYLAAVRYFSPEIAAGMRNGQRETWSCGDRTPGP